jgi:hypothetical protein
VPACADGGTGPGRSCCARAGGGPCVDSDSRMANLLTIMSRFASRMDQQQEQLSSIQAALMAPTPESGAIPKRREAGAVPQSSWAPSLQGLRADAAAAAQAASMVEALDLGGTDNFSNNSTSTRCPGPRISSLGRVGNLTYFTTSLTFCNLYKGASASLIALKIWP